MKSNVTKLLEKLDRGEEAAADELLPIVYDELRRLAAQKLSNERNSPSLQPTLLVHDAYVRLVDSDRQSLWENRAHFFAAAAEAMRRILVEHARRRKARKHGGDLERVGLSIVEPSDDRSPVDVLALDEALGLLEQQWPERARLVKLRFFTGMTIAEASRAMEISQATAQRYWQFSRAWLYDQLNADHA